MRPIGAFCYPILSTAAPVISLFLSFKSTLFASSKGKVSTSV